MNYYKRLLNVISRILKSIIPYNINYSPKSVFSCGDSNCSVPEGVKIKKVYADYYVDLILPSSFLSLMPDYYYYDVSHVSSYNRLTKRIDYYVFEISNGYLYTDNIGFIAVNNLNNTVLEDVSFFNRSSEVASINDSRYFRRKFFKKSEKIDGTVVSLLSGGAATWNLYHWFVDSISRIHLLEKSGVIKLNQVSKFLVPNYAIEYQIASLRMLGIHKEQIIVAKEDLHVNCTKLISTSNPRGTRSQLIPRWSNDFLRKKFSSIIKDRDKRFGDYIYISRKDSKRRIIVNEGKVEEMLAKYDFQSITLSELTLAERINLFSHAKIVISATGAGLTFLFLCQKGTKVIEIFGGGFVNYVYCNLAYLNDLEYNYLVFNPSKSSKSLKDAEHEDVFVDLEKLERLVISNFETEFQSESE